VIHGFAFYGCSGCRATLADRRAWLLALVIEGGEFFENTPLSSTATGGDHLARLLRRQRV
jgi:hypothetical protein